MRFNYESAMRGKCLIEVDVDGAGPLAKVWTGDPSTIQATEYSREICLPVEYTDAEVQDKPELLARLIAAHFETFGDFPGQTFEGKISDPFRGQLEALA